jgi:hypothetical protein
MINERLLVFVLMSLLTTVFESKALINFAGYEYCKRVPAYCANGQQM